MPNTVEPSIASLKIAAPKIAVIDYDMGNLHSACKGLQEAGAHTSVTDRADALHRADAVVLPGVGAFDPAMQHLNARGLAPVIRDVIDSGKPFLGICVGLQLLFEGSEEGQEAGLGIFPGTVKRFHSEPNLTIPHMGWNQLSLTQPKLALWKDLPEGAWLYFVHSYYVEPTDAKLTAATVTHGSQIVTAAIARNNVMAVQFHPEKSSTLGLKILANFVALVQQRQLVGAT
jgi:imidazole glycerol-phosphate synthase subunit HisH